MNVDTLEGFTGERIQNPVKAIRAKCLDCCCDSVIEVKLCTITSCALYPFRFGSNPYRQKREVTPERMAALQAARQNAKLAKNPL